MELPICGACSPLYSGPCFFLFFLLCCGMFSVTCKIKYCHWNDFIIAFEYPRNLLVSLGNQQFDWFCQWIYNIYFLTEAEMPKYLSCWRSCWCLAISGVRFRFASHVGMKTEPTQRRLSSNSSISEKAIPTCKFVWFVRSSLLFPRGLCFHLSFIITVFSFFFKKRKNSLNQM